MAQAATPTYNNGLYTPWTPAAAATTPAAAATTPAAAATTPAAAATTPAAAITTPAAATFITQPAETDVAVGEAESSAWWITTGSSSDMETSETSMTPVRTSSSSKSISSSTSSSSTTSSSATSTSSSLLSSSVSSSLIATGTLALSDASATAASATSSPSHFKIAYLIPIFVAVPIILIFFLLGTTYGKFWARRGSAPLTEGGVEGGFWGKGAGGSWSSRRSRQRQLDEEEEGGLVEKASLPSGSPALLSLEKEKPEDAPAMVKSASRWSNLFGVGQRKPPVPFLSVSYASLDKPFAPPSRSSSIASSLVRSGSKGDRGWGWGMALPRTKSSVYADAQAEEDHRVQSDGIWGMGTTSKRYRPRGAAGSGSTNSKGSVSSRLGKKLVSRLGGGGGGLTVPGVGPGGRALRADEMPSPSVYSPGFESQPRMSRHNDAYKGIAEDSDDEDEKLEEVDLDAFLGAARVGDGDLARRYMAGEDVHHPRSSTPAPNPFTRENGAPPTFQVDLPAAPSPLQISPKKAKSDLLRPAPPSDSARAPPPALLFDYSSSPEKKTAKRPLPKIPASRSSPQRGLTDPPNRLPFRSQSPPKLSRPSRSSSNPYAPPPADLFPSHIPPRTTATPLSPETRPDLFFAAPPMSPSLSSYGHGALGGGFASIGSPMPPFDPGALRASESAFSLSGLGGLVYQGQGGEDEGGLKDYAQRGKKGKSSRKDEIEQLRQSAPVVRPGMVVQSSIALQSAKAPLPSSSSSSSSRPRPSSHSQQQPISKKPAKPSLRPTSVPAPSSQPRESLGFNPIFPTSPPLAPLQHPNRVKAAVEDLEKRSSRETQPPLPVPSPGSPGQAGLLPAFVPSSPRAAVQEGKGGPREGRKKEATKKTKPPRLPSPPSPQKLERSTTTVSPPPARLAGGARYTRPLGGRHRGDSYEDGISGEDSDDSEAIARDRRVSMLIIQRSRSQSADGTLGGGFGLASASGSSEGHSEEGTAESVPLSQDKERLSRLLRKGSAGAGLGTTEAKEQEEQEEQGGVGKALEKMVRKSGIF
ncbi:hypothetical protein JCM11641_004824 [Rhodosporidiobolus odoratus]